MSSYPNLIKGALYCFRKQQKCVARRCTEREGNWRTREEFKLENNCKVRVTVK